MSVWARKVSEGWLLSVIVQPGAKQTQVAGQHAELLKIRVAAPPVGGRANDELLAFLARTLEVPKRCLRIVRGLSSRRKVVLVAAPQIDPVRVLLESAC